MIVDHEEAFQLACLKRTESNLARAYLDLRERATASLPCHSSDTSEPSYEEFAEWWRGTAMVGADAPARMVAWTAWSAAKRRAPPHERESSGLPNIRELSRGSPAHAVIRFVRDITNEELEKVGKVLVAAQGPCHTRWTGIDPAKPGGDKSMRVEGHVEDGVVVVDSIEEVPVHRGSGE